MGEKGKQNVYLTVIFILAVIIIGATAAFTIGITMAVKSNSERVGELMEINYQLSSQVSNLEQRLDLMDNRIDRNTEFLISE